MDEEINEATIIKHAVRQSQTLYRFSKRKKDTDFILTIGNCKAFCHKLVLCAASPCFDAICATGAYEITLEPFQYSQENEEVLQQLVRYIYLGIIDLTNDTVLSVLQAAHVIQYEELSAECEQFLLSTLRINSYQKFSETAERYRLKKLYRACDELCRENFSQLLETSWFLPSLSVNQLAGYLQYNELNIKCEYELLEAVRKWFNTSTTSEESKEDDVDTLLSHIRLSLCARSELKALAKDTEVPNKMILKINEFLHEKVKRAENKRSVTRSRTIIVGGRMQGNIGHNDIIHLEESEQNRTITTAKVCDALDDYSVCVHKDRIIISGGYATFTSKKSLASVHLFSTTTGQWTELPDLRAPRNKHGTVTIGDLLYVLAGCYREDDIDESYYTDVLVLDLTVMSWSTVAEIPFTVTDPSAAVCDGQIVVTGGEDYDQISHKTIKYEPHTDCWIPCADIPVNRAYSNTSTVSVGRRVFVLAHKDFLAYDITTNQWTTLPSPVRPSYDCAMVLFRGDLLALGGYEDTVQNPHSQVQMYDLHSHTWSVLEDTMPVPLSWHYAFIMKFSEVASQYRRSMRARSPREQQEDPESSNKTPRAAKRPQEQQEDPESSKRTLRPQEQQKDPESSKKTPRAAKRPREQQKDPKSSKKTPRATKRHREPREKTPKQQEDP